MKKKQIKEIIKIGEISEEKVNYFYAELIKKRINLLSLTPQQETILIKEVIAKLQQNL